MSDGRAKEPSCDIDGCLLPSGAGSTLWASLAADTGAFVLIIDEDGLVLCCNDLVNEVIGEDHAPLQGKQVTEFCTPGVASECGDVICRSINENRAISIVGMCRGVVTRSIARPLPTAPGRKRCAVKVVRPMNHRDVDEMNDGEGEWMMATSFDLGDLAELTSREMEVLRLIGESMTTAEIADRLHRSVKTIEWHRVSLGSKLGAANRVELARIASTAGLRFLPEKMFKKICRLTAAEHAVHPF